MLFCNPPRMTDVGRRLEAPQSDDRQCNGVISSLPVSATDFLYGRDLSHKCNVLNHQCVLRLSLRLFFGAQSVAVDLHNEAQIDAVQHFGESPSVAARPKILQIVREYHEILSNA